MPSVVMKTQRTLSRSVVVAVVCVAFALPACAQSKDKGEGPSTDTGKQFERAFNHERTSDKVAEYARGKPAHSFYVRLMSEDLSKLPSRSTCVDESFGAWIRKFFHKDAASSALVAEVSAPGEDQAKSIPLFEATVAENPNTCRTQVVHRPITPFYLVREGQGFNIDMAMKWSKEAKVGGVSSVVDAAKDLLGLANLGGSANLGALVASDTVANYAKKVDLSIAEHWRQTSQDMVREQISPYPPSGIDWKEYKNALVFQAAQVIADWKGVKVAKDRMPAVRLVPDYLDSYFSADDGRYMNSARILAQAIDIEEKYTFGMRLRGGIRGLNTVSALAINEPVAMRDFCSQLEQLLAEFLTEKDALAARYAILYHNTNYWNSEKLRDPMCLSEEDMQELAKLNVSFTLPDLERETTAKRDKEVEGRMLPVTLALLFQDKTALEALLSDTETFSMAVVHRDVFPKREDGDWGGTGQEAIDQLMEHPLGSGCYQAPPGQSLNAILAMVLLPNNKSTGVLVQFDDAGKLRALNFAKADFLAGLTSVRGWPAKNCAPIRRRGGLQASTRNCSNTLNTARRPWPAARRHP